jgi:hypothetical protein
VVHYRYESPDKELCKPAERQLMLAIKLSTVLRYLSMQNEVFTPMHLLEFALKIDQLYAKIILEQLNAQGHVYHNETHQTCA